MAWSRIFLATCVLLAFMDQTEPQNVRPTRFTLNQFFPTKGTSDPVTSETRAAVSIRDVIRRNTARFRRVIVRNINTNIVFVTEDARLMTSRAKSKLDVLASLVQSRWGAATKIRVIKSWTDVLDRAGLGLLSLHYEGRAFQVQLANDNRNLLSDLAVLSVEAGFDWVYYKNEDFIHISVIPDVCQTKLDLVFVVDTSGSVSYPHFQKIQAFLKKLVDFFNIAEDETRVGLITYSYSVIREFSLNQYYDKWQMKGAIDRMNYQGSNTATGDALRTMLNWAFTTGQGMRADKAIPKIGILLTDGRSNAGVSVYTAANEVKAAGINMFVIGVTDSPRREEINAIASLPVEDHYIYIEGFDDLSGFVDQISTTSCDEGAQLSQCESAATMVEGGSFKYFRGNFDQKAVRVTIEVVDIKGQSFLYTSLVNKNPGPLDEASTKKNQDLISPRALTEDLRSSKDKIVYISVQGQQEENQFQINIWDSLFAKDVYDFAPSEDKDSGLVVGTVAASATGYIFKYSIPYGNELRHFDIDPNTGVIRTTRKLDRENIPSYSLVVVAQDVNLQCHKGRAQVRIDVADINDNTPTFTQDPFRATVREDAPTGQPIIQVEATDADAGINAQLQFYITGGTGSDKFAINVNTGVVTLVSALDFESTPRFELDLRVDDSGDPKRSSSGKLLIAVEDVNEAPRFVNPDCLRGGGVCRYRTTEGADVGTVVGQTVGAIDPDTSSACTLQYEIISMDGAYFAVGATSGVVTNKVLIDRELKQNYRLAIRVRDCGVPPLTAEAFFEIEADDVNDNNPVFPVKRYDVSLSEGTSINTVFLRVAASDADVGVNGQVKYKVTGTEFFAINENTGEVRLTKSLDRETQSQHSFTVTATDQGTPSLSGSVMIYVQVTDVNDNAPTLVGPKSFTVAENARSGTEVGKVTAEDKDEGLNAQVRFTLDPKVVGVFVVDAFSGQLRTARPLDREAQETYTFSVTVNDLGSPTLSGSDTYTVTVLDENDNAPLFAKASYSVRIKEDLPIGSNVEKVAAGDLDKGSNALIVFSILSGAVNTFSIDADTGQVTLSAKLSFGTESVYSIAIQAQDKGTPTLASTVRLQVFVDDVNEFPPECVSTNVTASVKEDQRPVHPVVTVTCTDKDTGPSGTVAFTITSGNEGAKFAIDRNTGVVSLIGAIDFETVRSYKLTVTATDQGVDRKSQSVTVNILVEDVNDNQPKLLEPLVFTVSEDKPVTTVVGQLLGSDADSGPNAALVYTIFTSGVTDFTVERDGRITVARALDREKKDRYAFEVSVCDQGTPSLCDRKTVTVVVDDVNDNNPMFTKAGYTCGVQENAVPPAAVCIVAATDADVGANGRIVYSLVKASENFQIDKTSGEITTLKSLDRERLASETLKVRATDQGTPTRSTEVDVLVNIGDENDNQPTFTLSSYDTRFTEEQSRGTEVTKLTATDADIGSNAVVTYSILSGHMRGGTARFFIEQQNGVCTLKAERLDREDVDEYNLVIRAEDGGTRKLSSEVRVKVALDDINDNSPVFSSAKYTGQISESAGTGSFVVQVTATDRDIGDFGKVSYAITSGNEGNAFAIDSATGKISTAALLDYETIVKYVLGITASDGGSPRLTGTTTVEIAVLNEDDNAPEFEKVKEASTFENVALGTKIMQFKAMDKDGGTLRFSILSGNTKDAFNLDQATGLVTVKSQVDREEVAFYNLTVEVKDQAGQATTASLPITVLDLNDNAPKFSKDTYTGQIRENQSPPIDVVTVSATDRDIGSNQEITFRIDRGNDDGAFSIDGKTGLIRSAKPVDREKQASYRLVVVAEDGGTPRLQSSATVDVTVLDENDNDPVFSKSQYDVSVNENSGANVLLVNVVATDADAGDNGRVTYAITAGNELGLFRLAADTGKLELTASLDREARDLLTLEVTATDNGSPQRKSTAKVVVTVLDLNDNKPVILGPENIKPINESAAPGEIAIIKAEDKDLNKNAELVYKIAAGNGDGVFSLNPATGVLSLVKQLDRETKDKYKLSFVVEDKGIPVLSSDAKEYDIVVTDDNDNAPKFSAALYSGKISENQAGPTLVATVQATDADINENAVVAFSITGGNDDGAFTIDAATGKVYAAKPLDYEKETSRKLTVSAADWKYKTSVDVTIEIVNVNDNKPVFDKPSYLVTIPEDTAVGVNLVTVSATDLDAFGSIKYSIRASGSPFDVDPSTGQIRTTGPLDRETVDTYRLIAFATDSGSPSQSGTCNVTVVISDVNDNRPVTSELSAVVEIVENSAPGVFYKVSATDKDLGTNAEVRYKILGDPKDFAIDGRTGVVSSKTSFDREVTASTTLSVVAYDLGEPRQLESLPVTLQVNILDVNDNSPTWNKLNPVVEVSEALPAGSQVQNLDVRATDPDLGLNGTVRYSIVAGNEDLSFKIDEVTGVITINRSLDRETKSSYALEMMASDLGSPQRQTGTKLTVTILDANDNTPVIDDASLLQSVFENKPRGTLVGTVLAKDLDLGANGELVFSLQRNDLFAINPTNGTVTTLVALDREEKSFHLLDLTVADKGSPQLSVTRKLNITVLDEDDNCPMFVPKVYRVTVKEDLPLDTEVLRVFAFDIDDGKNAELDYAIASGNVNDAFKIDFETGVIRVFRGIDREDNDVYHLKVRAGNPDCGFTLNGTNIGEGTATDKTNRTTYADVYITALDVNDNPPSFVGEQRTFTFNNLMTRELTQLNATDPDLGDGGKVEFRRVDARSFSNEKRLVVEAYDLGSPSLSANTTLIIKTYLACEAMSFAVSTTGLVTMTTLCSVDNPHAEVTAMLGEKIILNCTAQGNQAPNYRWLKDGNVVSPWSASSELSIAPVTQDNDGNYACVASSDAGTIQSTASVVDIREAPTIVTQPESTVVAKCATLRLKVEARGDPAPTYQWYKFNSIIREAPSKELVLYNAIMADAASYYCVVRNGPTARDSVRSAVANVSVVDLATVVSLSLSVRTAKSKGDCHVFLVEEFEREVSKILGKQVSVTNLIKIDTSKFCNVTACTRQPCQNGGECTDLPGDAYYCTCSTVWSGDTCQNDVDECALSDTVCYGNGSVCQNSKGSFACKCGSDRTGKRCEYFVDACKSLPCGAGEVCVPSEIQNRTCLPSTKQIFIKVETSGKPWTEEEKYEMERKLLEMLRKMNRKPTTLRRRRRDVSGDVDYSGCKVHITGLPDADGVVPFVLDCSSATSNGTKTTEDISEKAVVDICEGLLDKERLLKGCGSNRDNMTKPTEPVIDTAKVTVEIVVKDKDGKAIGAEETINLISEKDLKANLEKVNVQVEGVDKGYTKSTGKGNKTIIIVVVVVVVLVVIVGILVTVYVVHSRRKKSGNDFKMEARSPSKDDLVRADGLNNAVYDDTGDRHTTFGKSNETFLFEMPKGLQKSN